MTQSNVNLSQDSDEAQSSLAQTLGETPFSGENFSGENIKQALDILSIEAEQLSDTQHQETAIANVNLLRNLMQETGVVPGEARTEAGSFRTMKSELGLSGRRDDVAAATTSGNSANQAMNVASRVQELGFVEFTAGLINGTFDAIIGATIKQMEAYAALVADLAKTLAQFQAENVTKAQVNAHLSNRYPDGIGGTSVRADYTFEATKADPNTGIAARTATENLKAIADALNLETAGLTAPLSLTIADGADKFTAEQITPIRAAIATMLASSMMDHLRAMAREGMARIVITEGSIRTKLTFRVSSTEAQKVQQAKYHRDSFDASVRGKAGWGWGSVSAGANYSNLNVNTVNETSTASITMTTEMIGEVNLKFRTETFAPILAAG
ncbi:MAG: hypothetical protein HC824_07760 [Synechococcales cyanobacterium RM1_1_8]|nr:hypothetical protein [Synechococcales cyanobacterium RM1_1_8]